MSQFNSALLIIDVQKGLDNPAYGERSTPEAETNIARLLAHWRVNGQPIIHVQHDSTEPNSPLRPGYPGNEIKEMAKPLAAEKLFRKSVNSAFIGTDLESYLREQSIHSLIVAGLTTDHCVSTSVRMAANLGFKVTLISDATATFGRRGPDGVDYNADQVHNVNLLSLNNEFCELLSTDQVLRHEVDSSES